MQELWEPTSGCTCLVTKIPTAFNLLCVCIYGTLLIDITPSRRNWSVPTWRKNREFHRTLRDSLGRRSSANERVSNVSLWLIPMNQYHGATAWNQERRVFRNKGSGKIWSLLLPRKSFPFAIFSSKGKRKISFSFVVAEIPLFLLSLLTLLKENQRISSRPWSIQIFPWHYLRVTNANYY